MPTRILREGIITSKRVNALAPEAELFYRRLMSVVDDYGRYFAEPTLLRAGCYPYQLKRVTDPMVSGWLAMCVATYLIFPYSVDATPYLQMLDTRQQIRSPSKYPAPDEKLFREFTAAAKHVESVRLANDKQMSSLVVDVDVVEVVVEVGDGVGAKLPEKSETDLLGQPQINGKHNYGVEARQILGFLNQKANKRFQANRTNLGFIVARLKDGATIGECRQIIVRKCNEWLRDPKSAVWCRPETLFGERKFAQYQGELVAPIADVPRETSHRP